MALTDLIKDYTRSYTSGKNSTGNTLVDMGMQYYDYNRNQEAIQESSSDLNKAYDNAGQQVSRALDPYLATGTESAARYSNLSDNRPDNQLNLPTLQNLPQYDEGYDIGSFDADQKLREEGYLENTPGYQFIRDEALQATERSGAAKGGLHSGTTLTALQDRASGLASTVYGQEYDKLANSYGINFNRANTRYDADTNRNINEYNADYKKSLTEYQSEEQEYQFDVKSSLQGLQTGQAAAIDKARQMSDLAVSKGETVSAREMAQRWNQQGAINDVVGYGVDRGYGSSQGQPGARSNDGSQGQGTTGANDGGGTGFFDGMWGESGQGQPNSGGGIADISMNSVFHEVGDLFSGDTYDKYFGADGSFTTSDFDLDSFWNDIGDFTIGDLSEGISDFFSGGGLGKVAKYTGDERIDTAANLTNKAQQMETTYGGSFWDAMGGDFSGAGNLGVGATNAYLATKGVQAWMQSGASNTEGKWGSAGGALAGGVLTAPMGGWGAPFGAIAGGVVGNVVGDIKNRLTGNADVDYEVRLSGGKGGFENGQYITTALGNIGMASEGTRNMNSSEVGSKLNAYAKKFIPFDQFIASGLLPNELAAVKQDMEGFKSNNASKQEYGSDPMAAMMKVRMESVKASLSPERLKASGFDKLIASYNKSMSGLDADAAREINQAVTAYNSKKKAAENNYRSFDEAANSKVVENIFNKYGINPTQKTDWEGSNTGVYKTVQIGYGKQTRLMV